MGIVRRLVKPIIESTLRGLVQELSMEDLSRLTSQINERLRRINPNFTIQPSEARKIIETIVEWILRRI